VSTKTKVLLIVVAIFLYLTWNVFTQMNDNRGYAPLQPIPFSHKIHAGDNKIPCLYCHSNVERSTAATVPSMATCMGCHNMVATGKPNIIELRKAYQEKKVIEWNRVHSLPDFVYFNHSMHIAKGIECQTCHGPVEQMEVVYQYRRLNMGDCVTCHRENKASIQCNTCHN